MLADRALDLKTTKIAVYFEIPFNSVLTADTSHTSSAPDGLSGPLLAQPSPGPQ
jgi:hypothetical protein